MISLEVIQLSKKYNRRLVFENLSFSHDSCILGISGSNGSGKSTLLKCLIGLARPNNGEIQWERDSKVYSRNEIKPLVGFTAPYINLYAELTAFENLEFLAELSGQQLEAGLIDALLSYVDMIELKDQLLKQLSTGQIQRIKLASALVNNPDILFLDEPGSNLDEKGQQVVSKIIQDQKEKGTFIVIASNDAREISLCDAVINLDSNE